MSRLPYEEIDRANAQISEEQGNKDNVEEYGKLCYTLLEGYLLHDLQVCPISTASILI